jgi:hypothetical protein
MSYLSHLKQQNLVWINIFSVLITGLSVLFAQYMFRIKAFVPNIERIKYIILLGGLIFISFLFLISIISLIWFVVIIIKRKKNRELAST